MHRFVLDRCYPITSAALGQIHRSVGRLSEVIEVNRADSAGNTQAHSDVYGLAMYQ